jgi:hypothetical protein
MLSKVNKTNIYLGTNELQKLYNDINYELAQDNLNNHIIYKLNNKNYIKNYITNKLYNHNRIQVEILGEKIIKQIDSFDQNNINISNKIRKTVLSLTNNTNNTYNNILGIGGEFYVYFKFIKANEYIGMSNHQCIVDDANYNVPYSKNYLVDYNNINIYTSITSNNISKADLIILNVYNICESIIKYIHNIKFQKLIIITCCLTDKKLKQLTKYFKLKTIKHIQNFNSWICVIEI